MSGSDVGKQGGAYPNTTNKCVHRATRKVVGK